MWIVFVVIDQVNSKNVVQSMISKRFLGNFDFDCFLDVNKSKLAIVYGFWTNV